MHLRDDLDTVALVVVVEGHGAQDLVHASLALEHVAQGEIAVAELSIVCLCLHSLSCGGVFGNGVLGIVGVADKAAGPIRAKHNVRHPVSNVLAHKLLDQAVANRARLAIVRDAVH